MNTRGRNGTNQRTVPTRQRSFRLAPITQAVALILAAGGAMGQAHAAPAFSSAWFSNKGAIQNTVRNTGLLPNGMPATGLNNSDVQRAQQQTQKSIADLGLAAQGIAAAQAWQASQRQIALSAGNGGIPDGLAAGGLNVDTNSLTQTWIDAQAPTQSVDASGHVTVNVTQTASRAILSWSSFNVGKNTTLNFDQSGGTQTNGANDWAVLNRINDPNGKPSQILGSITAQGSVYVIDRNGIMFGGGSQVNVHALVASSLDFLNTNDDLVQTPSDVAASNALFLQTSGGGLAGLEAGATQLSASTGLPNEVLGLGNQVKVTSADAFQPPGDVTIEPGASISTQTTGSISDGGFVLIAAPNVNNGGTISATAGQVVLAAGVGVSLRPNPENPQQLLPELSGQIEIPSGSLSVLPTDVTPAGTLTNTGLVQTARGSINLLGSSVVQNGVVTASTSVTTPGSITVSTVDEYYANTPTGSAYPGDGQVTAGQFGGADDTHRAGSLVFGAGSTTTILPEEDGGTATSSPGVTFTPGRLTLTAGSVWFQGGSLIEAPGATVSVNALTPSDAGDATPPNSVTVPGRIYVDSGATIDVAGLADVQESVADTLVTIGLIGQNELADSPLLRNSFLFGLKNVVIDSTLSGTRDDGTPWVGSPVLNAQGYVDLIPRSIDQLLTNGGTITLAGNEVMTAAGSSLNLAGGYVHYLGGLVNTTVLEDQYGRLIPIGQADPNDVIVGIAGQYISSHPRWGVSETYQSALIGRPIYEDDFIVGGNAGTLNVYGSQAVVLDGEMDAQVVSGARQVVDNAQPIGGAFNLGAAALAQLTQGPNTSTTGETGTVILQNDAPQLSLLAPDFSATTPLDGDALNTLSDTDPDNVLATTVVPVGTLNSGGFAHVSVNENETNTGGIVVAAGTQLAVQPGGSIAFNSPGAGITVLGSLIAPSGTITLSSGGALSGQIGGEIIVGSGGVISVRGQWVNNEAPATSGPKSGSSEYINGGSITLSTALASGTTPDGADQTGTTTDTSGSILLQMGSVLDVSSGGELQADGQMLMQNGIAQGTAGSLSLLTYANNNSSPYGSIGGPTLPTDQPTAGQIEMDGTINSFGFAGGGTLTLQALGFQIGGDPGQAPAWALNLANDFFAQQGFGKYVLNAMYDTSVAPDTQVILSQKNLIPNIPALQQAASGADLLANGLTGVGTLDPYFRPPTDLIMTAGAYLAWQSSSSGRPLYPDVTGGVTVGAGASIVGDAGASIGLGSPAQVTVLGSLVAPGGAITLSADSIGNGFGLPGQESTGKDQSFGGFTSPTKSVWLGANALLDVAGVGLTDPFAPFVRNGFDVIQADTGKVLPGGSVVISDDSGYVVAQAGSRIDVSGTSATFDQTQASGYAPQQVWSDAGSITLAASDGLLFDGTLQAQPGAAQAQGGTLTILPEQTALSAANGGQPGGGTPVSSPGAQIVVLQQSGDLVPVGLMPGEDFPGEIAVTQNGKTSLQSSTGVIQFVVDRLAGSGVATLVIGGDSAVNANQGASVPVVFAGNVNLTLANAVEINTGQLVALSGAQAASLFATVDPVTGTTRSPSTLSQLLALDPATIGTTVTIDAPYVALVGSTLNSNSTAFKPIEAIADSAFTINASFIDLINQLQLNNFSQADFNSGSDIRLTSTNIALTGGTNALTPGELFTPGNLAFDAADLYPSTGSTFILDAVGPADGSGNPAPTTITFQSNGAPSVAPLSAGGALLVDATDIVQSGTVRAPSGNLIFGVGNPQDKPTLAQFNELPLVATNSVSLTSGSVTSVSNDGAIIPYGTTVDGVEWQFNPVPNASPAPDVTAPPAKFVSVNGSSVSLNAGATIDLSGAGDLQAEEWVPGTGGSRDVLSQYNISYGAVASGVAVPTNVGASNVYAIVPGPQSPVSAYDPIFAQTTQPAVSASGTVGTTTAGMAVGHAGLNDAAGESVYLSNVPGLPAGYYTLLPAKYATLPGAYRVTVASSADTVLPGEHDTAPDGTQVVAGYWANALTGSRSATPTLFDVQSGATWQQYSQYTLTGANSFFPSLAASAGNVTPPLPMDGGQLVLAATSNLTLGASLRTQAAAGGAPAEVDIASQAIQIIGSGEAALPGYIQISADQLDALNAGSLLIGGTRTQGANGTTINPIANSVVVSNDAADPLTGPEVMLVSANTLQIDAGSTIAAQGAYPAAKDQPITIGAGAAGTSDGALLIVSNGGDSVVSRAGTVNGTGSLTVGAGASLSGGQALTLDSSGNLTFDPAASLSGNIIAVDGSAITFTSQTGAGAAALPGFVVGPAQIAQLAQAQEVILRSSGVMTFDGSTDVTFGNAVDLSAGVFQGNGGSATINAPEVMFSNDLAAPDTEDAASASASGSLTVNANQIDFGNGDATVSGFGSVTMNATNGVVAQGNGTFDGGTAPLTFNAPLYLAGTGSGSTVKTAGELILNSASGTALALPALGGALSFIGGTVNDNGATISAPGGNVSLEATSGDLTIGSGSAIRATGVALPFFDIVEYAPAGAIKLNADTGSVNVAAGSTLDLSGAAGGGEAGTLALSAPMQTVSLAGTILGQAAAGYIGGSFTLNTGGAVDLDNLAADLASSGVNDAISVQTNAGNLILSAGNTLSAHLVSLTADGGAGGQDTSNGAIQIDGTIDASGNAGGEIDLYGKSGVNVQGSLIATGSSATQRGGAVNIGTTAIVNQATVAVDPTYGYESIASAQSGTITVGANALIDVSGGSAGGLSGGTVSFRAPIVQDPNGGTTVNVSLPSVFAPGKGIAGSRSTTLEAYAIWSTDDPGTGAKHFDGIVDPAGWYDSQGGLVAGTFTSQNGSTTITYTPANGTTPASLSNAPGATPDQVAADLAADLANDYFVPATPSVDTNHETFYGYSGGAAANGPGTLMGFVNDGVQNVASKFASTGIANLKVIPGIELDNPDSKINSGNISILTTWNLDAGTSPTDLAFRFNDQAPVITFLAENNVDVKASLTDGFFQIANPVSGASASVPNIKTYGYFSADQAAYNKKAGAYKYTFSYYGPKGNNNYHNLISLPVNLASADPTEQEEYYALYTAYASFLDTPAPAQTVTHGVAKPGSDYLGVIAKLVGVGSVQASVPAPPVAPSATEQLTDPGSYLLYLVSYATWFNTVVVEFKLPKTPPPAAPIAQLGETVLTGTTVSAPGGTDNTPSPAVAPANPLSLAAASLIGGSSSSFRVVAGADSDSANPLALQPDSAFAAEAGNVTLDGHFAYATGTPGNLASLVPTMIRTGTGAIDIAAANNIDLSDSLAPGVIYTAGEPASGAPSGNTATIIGGAAASRNPNILVSPSVSPDAAGDISLYAQNDITGIENTIDSTGAVSGAAGTSIAQFWWQWMEVSNPTGLVGLSNPTTQIVQTSIDFAAFDQGVMSVGGNVSVSAGGNISDLAVSLPTTWYLTNTNTDNPTKNTVGGGNLTVTAGGNILSGDYFVAQGTGTITAGGLIGSDITTANALGQPTSVSTLLATQAGALNVSARQGADIGGVFNPSLVQSNVLSGIYHQQPDGQAYSANSSVNVESTTGNVGFETLDAFAFIGDDASANSLTLPAIVNLTAYTGGITVASGATLTPSPTGELSLIANQSINLDGSNGGAKFGMPGGNPSSIDETDPVRIYSSTGSIVDGVPEPAGSGADAGFYDALLEIVADKPAMIEAGQDIVNLSFQGQNLSDDDLTRIVAGRDIYDTPLVFDAKQIPSLQLGGPGYFDVEAGRNIGPLTSQAQAYASLGAGYPITQTGIPTGIQAIGNADNPALPQQSANIQILFGVGPGIDDASFTASYINPASTVPDVPSATPALIAFMEQYNAGQGFDTGLVIDKPVIQPLTADQAWAQFQALPPSLQQIFVQQVFFSILTDVGTDYNNASSPFFQQYARGYQAINTLFPASLGYTANNLSGGANGANTPVSTGNLDIRSTTIQTQQGGNISILGPGGEALVGSTLAPPEIVRAFGSINQVVAGPSTQGILTLEKGDINIFTDRSLLLAQSRIFTEQGGAMTIWSSNGDINAGKGAKSTADIPPPLYVCDVNHYCTVDARGEVTGAGIATLQTIPGAPASDARLIAPRGTVDAGDAGIRVSGNLDVAALHVANADNIQVQGKSTGIPIIAQVNVGALTSASAAASEAATAAANVVHQQQAAARQALPSIITVQVLGFGDTQTDSENERKKAVPALSAPGSQASTVRYDEKSPLQIVGRGGDLYPRQVARLTDDQRRRLQQGR